MARSLSLPLVMSFNGDYVDTAGFLALQGLFTAHVTGAFGAAMIQGASGGALTATDVVYRRPEQICRD